MDVRATYKKTERLIQTLFSSKVRTMILLSLLQKPMTLGELEENLKYKTGTLYHRIKELKSEGQLVKKEGFYRLTKLGEKNTVNLKKIIEYLYVVEKYRNFFSKRGIDFIPSVLFSKIGELETSSLYREEVDPARPILFISEIFKSSRENIFGITNVGTSKWAELFERKLDEGVKISIIVSEDVFKKIKEKSKLLQKKMEIKRMKNPNFMLILTENDFLFALSKGGVLDLTNMIHSQDERALSWGRMLFEHFWKN
ncbi:MAG: helix-turn-helix transcriptional regulator [Candidatus Methanofastidiosia archaeon]